MKLINQENRPVFFLVRTLYQFIYLFICLSSSEDIFSLPLEGEEEGVGSRDRERERERQRERETEKERNINVRETSIACLLLCDPTGMCPQPGMCPDWESNQQPLSLWDDSPTN